MTRNKGPLGRRGIKTISIITLMLAVAGCAGSAATVDTRVGGGSAGNASAFAGTWEGAFDANEYSGEMMLALTYDSGTCTGSLTASAMGGTRTADIENFKSEGIDCSFQTYLQGMDFHFKGKIEAGKMIGTFQVYIEGNLQGEGTFDFVKK
ncbi:hypothetical protein ACFL6R_05145 [Gemmatimonadota bacterium]